MNRMKMTFRLTKDEDGYPPDDYETLWVEPINEKCYRIDNIPFYVMDLSPDDTVYGYFEDDILFFEKKISESTTSVLRIIFFMVDRADNVMLDLSRMGAKWEGSHLRNLYSVAIENKGQIEDIVLYLSELEAAGVLEYEEASLR